MPAISVDNFNTDVGNNLIERVFFWDRELSLYFSYQYDAWEEVRRNFAVGGEVSYDDIDWDLIQGSAEYRRNLINSTKLLKKHIEKEYSLSRSSVARGRKKSIKRRRKKKSCVTRRKRKPRRKRLFNF